jgi:hypothetical protein
MNNHDFECGCAQTLLWKNPYLAIFSGGFEALYVIQRVCKYTWLCFVATCWSKRLSARKSELMLFVMVDFRLMLASEA